MPQFVDQTKVQLFIVVSHKFSRAIGPFIDASEATQVAQQLTENSESGKVYVPVPFFPLGPVAIAQMDDEGNAQMKEADKDDDGGHPGQYL